MQLPRGRASTGDAPGRVWRFSSRTTPTGAAGRRRRRRPVRRGRSRHRPGSRPGPAAGRPAGPGPRGRGPASGLVRSGSARQIARAWAAVQAALGQGPPQRRVRGQVTGPGRPPGPRPTARRPTPAPPRTPTRRCSQPLRRRRSRLPATEPRSIAARSGARGRPARRRARPGPRDSKTALTAWARDRRGPGLAAGRWP